ncbi:hypothetical protein DXG47_09225, partial [Salmonella enterica]|nr:hypothetical protein [Salmonella enterica]
NHRPGFDNWRSQLDRPGAQRTGCPKGERSESIPPSPPYLRKSSYESTGFFFALPPVDYRMMAQFTSALSAYREHNTIRLTISRHKKTGR